MPLPKDPEKFLNQQGFSRDELAQKLAEGLSSFARLAPPLPQPTPAAQMSREVTTTKVELPIKGGPTQQANSAPGVGEPPAAATELTFEIDVSGVVEDVILLGYFP